MLGKFLGDNDEDYIITEGQLRDAIDSADDRATRFQEKLELAYTYNQINETEKENLLGMRSSLISHKLSPQKGLLFSFSY